MLCLGLAEDSYLGPDLLARVWEVWVLLGKYDGARTSISSRNHLLTDNARKNCRTEKLLTICPEFVKIKAPHQGR